MDAVSSNRSVTERFLPVGSARLYIREIGQGLPIIVVHGGPDFDHAYLLPDLDRLADRFRLVYYDQRGRGRSYANEQPEDVTITTEVDDLDLVRDSIGSHAVALLGHSWGGLLAMEYATRRPERVSHLILMNTAPASHVRAAAVRSALALKRSPEQAERLAAIQSDARYQAGDIDADLEYHRIHFAAGVRSPEHLERVITGLRSHFTEEGIVAARGIEHRLYEETWASETYDLMPLLRRLSVPTLVIHGDDDFIPADVARELATAIPQSRLVVLPESGHFSYLDQPDRVGATIEEFLSSS